MLPSSIGLKVTTLSILSSFAAKCLASVSFLAFFGCAATKRFSKGDWCTLAVSASRPDGVTPTRFALLVESRSQEPRQVGSEERRVVCAAATGDVLRLGEDDYQIIGFEALEGPLSVDAIDHAKWVSDPIQVDCSIEPSAGSACFALRARNGVCISIDRSLHGQYGVAAHFGELSTNIRQGALTYVSISSDTGSFRWWDLPEGRWSIALFDLSTDVAIDVEVVDVGRAEVSELRISEQDGRPRFSR